MSGYSFSTELIAEHSTFSNDLIEKARFAISKYPEGKQKSAVLEILHDVQNEFGWVSVVAMDRVAELLAIQPIEVYEVASFYTMFNLEPTGKYVLEVCRTGPCQLRGAEELITYLENKTGGHHGHPSPDGLFTIKPVECLAACGGAPCLQVRLKTLDGDYKYYENLDAGTVDRLIAEEWI
jgi:NADH-quinone oxidoreductase subunit E